jgi:hypothetical protein
MTVTAALALEVVEALMRPSLVRVAVLIEDAANDDEPARTAAELTLTVAVIVFVVVVVVLVWLPPPATTVTGPADAAWAAEVCFMLDPACTVTVPPET